MADFPSSPSNGDTHIIGNTIWVYNSGVDSWLIQDVNEYAVANLQNTPPANPDEGTLWYDSQTTGRLFIFINGAWIDASPGDNSDLVGGNDITVTQANNQYTIDVDNVFLRKDGTNNGASDVVVNDADFIVRDSTDGTTNFIWRDHSANELKLGTANAKVTLRSDLDMNGNDIQFDSTNTGINWSMNTDGAYIKFFNTGDGDSNSRLEYATFDNGNEYHRWLVNSTERMRVTSSGANITGNIVATENLTVSTGNATGGGIILADDGDIVDLNDAYCSMRFSYGVRVYSGNRTGSVRHTLHSNGTFSATGDVIAFASDNRLKNIEGRVKNALDIVDNLNGYYYRFNELAEEFEYDTESRQVGVSAQEVEAVLPEVVKPAPINEGNDTDYKTVQYEKLVPVLIEAIKELRAEIETLKGK